MSTTQPIRNKEQLAEFKEYYKSIKPNARNYLLIIMGMNTALRISDILALRWEDVYFFERMEYKSHISLCEKKTGKRNTLALNPSVTEAMRSYAKETGLQKGNYIFQSRKGENDPITRQQAFRIVREAAAYAGLSEPVSCHSLRKTFGYYAWKQGVSPVLLMKIYNHSSFVVTQRYLGIEQEEKDDVFLNICL